MAPSGGRPRRVVRFARLIHRRGRDLGGPSVRAACGGNLSLPWLPRRVIRVRLGSRGFPLQLCSRGREGRPHYREGGKYLDVYLLLVVLVLDKLGAVLMAWSRLRGHR
jgi:hypothetical protein